MLHNDEADDMHSSNHDAEIPRKFYVLLSDVKDRFVDSSMIFCLLQSGHPIHHSD